MTGQAESPKTAVTRWICPVCEEPNRADRVQCNGCGQARNDATTGQAGAKAGIVLSRSCFSAEQIHDRSWVNPVIQVSQHYGNRTPAQQKLWIESHELHELEALRKERGNGYPHLVGEEAAIELLRQLEAGTAKTWTNDEGSMSLATGGLAPTQMADFGIVSGPGIDKRLYSRTLMACAQLGIGLAIVWEQHWGGIWFWVWKRNVDRMHEANKTLVVLTRRGMSPNIGFAQSIEVLYLKQRGYPFVVVDIEDFCHGMFMLRGLVDWEDWPSMEQLLRSPRKFGSPPLTGIRDENGHLALHRAATEAPAHIIELICKAGEDVNDKAWACDESEVGWTPLHYAVAFECQSSQPSHAGMVKRLLDLRADPHAQAGNGKKPIDSTTCSQECAAILQAYM